MKKVINHSCF